MEENSLYFIYLGARVSCPAKRAEVRALVVACQAKRNEITRTGGNPYQFNLDQGDAVQKLISEWPIEERINFLNLSTEETVALTHQINQDTNIAIANQDSTNQILAWVIAIIIGLAFFAALMGRHSTY